MNPQAEFSQLNEAQQALVAATLMERMLPNYLLFSEVAEFGDGKILRDALSLVWEKQQVKHLKVNIDKQLEKIEPNIPDVADFDLFGVYPALDAAMALCALLAGMKGDEQGFADVCQLSLGTVNKVAEQELAAANDEITDAMLAEHELVEYETGFQMMLIDWVCETEKPNNATIKQFRSRALEDGVTNIGIEV